MKRFILAIVLMTTVTFMMSSCATSKSSSRGGCNTTKGMVGYR